MNPLNWFPGYKTYIIAAAGMVTALGGFLDGSVPLGDFVEYVFLGIGAFTFRKGISNGGA